MLSHVVLRYPVEQLYYSGSLGRQVVRRARLTVLIAYLDRWVDVQMLGDSLGEAKSNLKALLDRGKLPPVNYVDVAFAKAVSEEVVSYEILALGERKGIDRCQLGDRVVMSGRIAGVT